MSEPKFDPAKFNELIVYIATRLGPEAALGRVKLAKLLMQSDFGAYERRRAPITGATYEKWEHGHLPKQMLLAQRLDVEHRPRREHQHAAHTGPEPVGRCDARWYPIASDLPSTARRGRIGV
jgi:hypothetical protein